MAQDVVKSSTLTTPTIGIELNGLPTRNSESNIGLFHTTSRTSHHTLRDKAVLGGGDEEAPQLTPTLTTATVAHSFPDGGLRAWLVVFGSSLTIFTTWGLVNSIGVFQSYWQAHQLSHLEPTAIGWISSVNIFLNLFLGVQIGPLFDRYGSRWLMLTGSVSYVVSLVCLAECKEYWQFMLTWGVLAGVASTMLTTVSISVVAHWFEVKRGQASGVTFIGSSVGGVLFPLALEPMLEKLGWAWSMRIVALLVAVGLVIGNICVKGRLPKGKRGGAIDLRCFSDIRFSMATVGVAGFEFVLVGVLGLLPTFVLYAGYDSKTSFTAVAVLNAGSAVGRYTSGFTSDRYGRFNTMCVTLAFSIIVTFCLWLPIGTFTSAQISNSSSGPLALLYIFVLLFGFGSGSVISLAPVCFGQLCKASEYGQYYGTGYSLVSFATLICIPIGGALLPAIGTQGLAGFFGAVLVLSCVCFVFARWACLEYAWKWRVNI